MVPLSIIFGQSLQSSILINLSVNISYLSFENLELVFKPSIVLCIQKPKSESTS